MFLSLSGDFEAMEIETSYPHNFMSNPFVEEENNQEWTKEDDTTFEYALDIFDEDTPSRWESVAAIFPGKTVNDMIKRYKKLEEDVRAIEEGYYDSSFSLEMVGDHSDNGSKKSYEDRRKKVVHWTQEEHKLFLDGLEKCGKGDWRNIARKFVVTKTPSQVASHAQKYFNRQKLSKGGQDKKRRASIHDITLGEDKSLPLPLRFQVSQMPSPQQKKKKTSIQEVQHEWIKYDHNNDQLMGFNPNNDDRSMLSSQYHGVTGEQDLHDIFFSFVQH